MGKEEGGIKNIKIKILFFIFFLISCENNNIYNKVSYYDNGNIKYKIEYFNKKDTSSYIKTGYYRNGSIKYIFPFKNNMINGKVLNYYKSNNILSRKIKESCYFINGKRNGILRKYTKNAELMYEKLYINDTSLFIYEYYLNDSTKHILKVLNTINPKNGKLYEIGYIDYNANKEIIKEKSNLYIYQANDTIDKQSKYCFNIFTPNFYGIISVKLYVGKLYVDSNMKINVVDTQYVFYGDKNLDFRISECINYNNIGYNLFLGKYVIKMYAIIEGKKTIIELEAPVFADYYVKNI